MLHLPHKLNFLDPSSDANPLERGNLQLSPAPVEDDELIASIEAQAEANDDNWELVESTDAAALAEFWTGVDDEARRDPDWTFADD